jgi:hypothetical protein
VHLDAQRIPLGLGRLGAAAQLVALLLGLVARSFESSVLALQIADAID